MRYVLVILAVSLISTQVWASPSIVCTGTDSSAAASITMNVCAGVADGDSMYAQIGGGSTTTAQQESVNAPAGWSAIAGATYVSQGSLTNFSFQSIYCHVASSEPSTYAWSITPSTNSPNVQIAHYIIRGLSGCTVDQSSVLAESQNLGGDGTHVTVPGFTPSFTNDFLLGFFTWTSTSNVFTQTFGSSPPALGSSPDYTITTHRQPLEGFHVQLTSTSAVPAQTGTLTTSDFWVASLVAAEVAPTATPTFTATFTPTFTPTSTSTPSPTPTSTFTFTPTTTPTQTSTPTPTATATAAGGTPTATHVGATITPTAEPTPCPGATAVHACSAYFAASGQSLTPGDIPSLSLTTGTVELYAAQQIVLGGTFGTMASIPNFYFFGMNWPNHDPTALDYTIPLFNDSGTSMGSGPWSHVVFTFQDGVANGSNIYQNGTLRRNFTYNIGTKKGWFTIGMRDSVNETGTCPLSSFVVGYCQWEGTLSQVAVFDKVLTPAQISTHLAHATTASNYESAVLADGPIAYWPLDDFGPIARDISGHSRNASAFPLLTFPTYRVASVNGIGEVVQCPDCSGATATPTATISPTPTSAPTSTATPTATSTPTQTQTPIPPATCKGVVIESDDDTINTFPGAIGPTPVP